METEVLIFELDHHLFGIETEYVTEVLRAVALSPLPGAPAEVTGVMNLRGRIVPVINTRKALGFAELPIRHTDHFVVVRQPGLVFALHLDRAVELIRLTSQTDQPDDTELRQGVGERPLVKGFLQAEQGMVQVIDLSAVLSSEERLALATTLSASAAEVNKQHSP